MTALTALLCVMIFFLLPYLTGNIYELIFDGKKSKKQEKKTGFAGTYFSGVAIVYAGLLVLQMIFIKFRFNFIQIKAVYTLYFALLSLAGSLCLMMRLKFKKMGKTDIVWQKKAWWIYVLILFQGILNIVLKNPYFENNGLWEITKVILKTDTIYEYNAFTGLPATAGFPLSNKLMFLPVLYAYASSMLDINPAWLFNYIVPAVTLISFYLLMLLWVQKLAEEEKTNWMSTMAVLIALIQTGDGWTHLTAFRILHTGYAGEAIFFGILVMYCLYSIKNKCYLIAAISIASFPGLVKYDALTVYIKEFDNYRSEMMYGSKIALLFAVALILYVKRKKKFSTHLLSPNLTLCIECERIWMDVVKKEKGKIKRYCSGAIVIVVLLLCQNMTIISDAVEWRSNVYGAKKTEYELLKFLAAEQNGEEEILILAQDNVNQWIKRLDFPIETVVGYDCGHNASAWYSYEEYDESHQTAWDCVNRLEGRLEKLDGVCDDFSPDYVVLEHITDELPIQDNARYECILEWEDYLVYSVDKQ